MVSEIQRLVANIIDIDNKIKQEVNSDNFNNLSKFLSDKNEYILTLKKILSCAVTVDEVDNLTVLLTMERELVNLVVNKIAQLKKSQEKDRQLIKSLTSYLKVTKELTNNINLKL